MMTKLTTGPVLLLVLCMAAFGYDLSREQTATDVIKPATTMFPDGRDYDFGTVKTGTLVKQTFRVVNPSKVPLEITSMRAAMGVPATYFVFKSKLRPNEEGKVEITVDTSRFRGAKTIRLWLTTEQGEATQTFRFTIKGISQE